MLKNKSLITLLFVAICFLFQNCKKVTPPPTLTLSKSSVELGDITSSIKSQLKFIKTGVGTISYTISSNKTWLVVSKESGSLVVTNDSLDIKTNVASNDLVEGENVALLTIKPLINGIAGTDVLVRVSGMFKNTLLVASSLTADFKIIKAPKRLTISLSKVGLENLSFEATSDKAFIKIDKSQGTITGKLDLNVDLDPTNLEAGNFDGKITIIPKVNNLAGTPIVVLVTGSFDDVISGNIDAHTLSKNERWGGTINLNGNVIVPVGKTLTILPGAKIFVAKGPGLGLNITVNGLLKMNGEPGKIIEMKGYENLNNDIWEGIFVNADAEITYSYFRNALHPVNFENYSSANKPQKAPAINNVFFDNCGFGMTAYQSDFEATFFNLSFRNIEYLCFLLSNNQKTTLLDCEFNTLKSYIDIGLRASLANLTLRNCNFTKKIKPQSHVEVLDGFKNVKVTATNAYQMDINVGFGSNGNVLTNTPVFTELKNIGCGFTGSY
jgi:Viral BACON domain